MVINDFWKDLSEIAQSRGSSIRGLARDIGMDYSAMKSAVSGAIVTRGYMEVCEYLGYDIEIRYVKGSGSVLNDFREDVKDLAAGRYLSDVAYGMGMSRQLLDGRIKHAAINKAFVALYGRLGYDVELRYIQR